MSLLRLAWAYFRHRLLLALSALGLALGVAVLFAALAVINGFQIEFERTLREFAGDAAVKPPPTSFGHWEFSLFTDVLDQVEGIDSYQPRLNWYGLVGRRGSRALDDPRSADLSGLLLVGLDPEAESATPLGKQADLERHLSPAGDGQAPPVLLGEEAAQRLGLEAGDTLEVLSFYHPTGGRAVPIRRSFRMTGTFATGQFDQDLDRALVRRDDLVAFTRRQPPFSEIVLRSKSGVDPKELSEEVDRALLEAGISRSPLGMTMSWDEMGGKFLLAVENQKGILVTVFFFIVLVAAYQLVATLTLTVTEKRRDIGVLGALGATPGRIISFFVGLGLLISVIGAGLGLLLGYWLCRNLRLVESWISGGEPIFTAEVYKFEEIPVSIQPQATLLLVGATLSTALFFSLFPAWRAVRMEIVKALHSAR